MSSVWEAEAEIKAWAGPRSAEVQGSPSSLLCWCVAVLPPWAPAAATVLCLCLCPRRARSSFLFLESVSYLGT